MGLPADLWERGIMLCEAFIFSTDYYYLFLHGLEILSSPIQGVLLQ